MLQIEAEREEDTLSFGRLLGELVRPGDVIGLSGPLGAGKTVLVRGLAEGLGCDPERVRSPSFTLMVSYERGRLPLHHLDLYRLTPSEEDRLALREILFGTGVCAIEWFERFGEDLPHLSVEIGMVRSDSESTEPANRSHARRIRLRASGDQYRPLIEMIRSKCP